MGINDYLYCLLLYLFNPTIVDTLASNPIKKYKLIKTTPITGTSTVKEPYYGSLRNIQAIDEKNIFNLPYANQIKSFVRTLEISLPNVDLTILYNNLNNLTIEKRPLYIKNLFVSNKLLGKYLMLQNKIVIYYSKNISALNHELLHACSTIMNSDYCYCGLSVRKVGYDHTFGLSLNEGYTQLLNERLFPSKTTPSYHFEKIVSSFVEEIIGEDMMEYYYFKANLSSFIDELGKYNNISSIMAFISNFDFVSENLFKDNYSEKLDNQIQNKLSSMANFLYVTYFKMLIQKCESCEQTNNCLNQYAKKLMINFQNNSRIYTFLSSNDINFNNLNLIASVSNFPEQKNSRLS